MSDPSDYVREDDMADLWNVWSHELHHRVVGRTFKVGRILYSGESPFQRIDVFNTNVFDINPTVIFQCANSRNNHDR